MYNRRCSVAYVEPESGGVVGPWRTALQVFALLAVYAVTWAGVYGIAFPLLIMALVPLRQYAFPRQGRPAPNHPLITP